jgi:hypothetical protein
MVMVTDIHLGRQDEVLVDTFITVAYSAKGVG